jgi:transcriptional regulator CtsR
MTDLDVATKFECKPSTINAIVKGRHYVMERATAKKALRKAGLIS